ncbi:hypothetical protein SH467x_003259 [Pirellulaceae bacterium SH467]
MKLRKNLLKPLRMDWHGCPTTDLTTVTGDRSIAQLLDYAPFQSLLRRPIQLLQAYEQDRRGSLLARIFQFANRSHAIVDRVVVFAPPEIKQAIESIWSTCCQPFWNELSRGDRGSKPRITFVGHELDNDSIQGALHMLGAHRDVICHDVSDRWSIVIIEPGEGSRRSDLALRYFLPALRNQLGNDPTWIRDCVVAVTSPRNRWLDSYTELGLSRYLELTDCVGFTDSLATAATLLPAALLGVNVMELLAGASAGSRCTEQAFELSHSPIHLALANGSIHPVWNPHPRILQLWGSSLRPIGEWYEAMVDLSLQNTFATSRFGCESEESPSIHPMEATPSAIQSSRLVRHHITTGAWRFDALELSPGKSLPSIWQRELELCIERFQQAGRVQTQMDLPIIDELHVGQLMQWLQIAIATERWLQCTDVGTLAGS